MPDNFEEDRRRNVDYDLGRIESKLDDMAARQDRIHMAVLKVSEAHDTRIRSVEKKTYATQVIGGVVAIGLGALSSLKVILGGN